MLTVLLGGARSGKSSAALRMALGHSGPVTYVATSPRIDGDDDLDERITAHRDERPAHWTTVEAEVDLVGAVRAADGLVVIDCLTVWCGNLLHHGSDHLGAMAASHAALDAALERGDDTIAISNEVGLGIVPDNPLARRYRDLLGRINQQWVGAADQAHFIIAGRALPLTELGRPLP